MGKPQLVLHISENKLVSLGMTFHATWACSFILILKVIIDLSNCVYLKVSLLNLIAISSTWARVIDVMDNEVSFIAALKLICNYLQLITFASDILITLLIQSGSRLFGFIGAGATLGQLFGSLFAATMAWLGPCTYDFLNKKMSS